MAFCNIVCVWFFWRCVRVRSYLSIGENAASQSQVVIRAHYLQLEAELQRYGKSICACNSFISEICEMHPFEVTMQS